MIAISFQLLVSSWKRTLIPGMCGFLAGAVYHINVLKIRRVKVNLFEMLNLSYQMCTYV